MIFGYAQDYLYEETLKLFNQMQQESNVEVNQITFGTILAACAGMKYMKQVERVHVCINQRGFE